MTEVASEFLPRISAADRAVRDAQSALNDRRAQRDTLIVRATDAGISGRAIAAAAGVGQSRIVAIVAASG